MAKVKTIIVDPLCRVEGDGGITVDIVGNKVTKVHMDIFEGLRFFEGIIVGKQFDEVPLIVSRICAICSVSHRLASIRAIEKAFDVKVTTQTELFRELIHLGEMIESHALHLFCLAIPDYLDYTGIADMAKDYSNEVAIGLELKKLGNTIQEKIGGRCIHPENLVVGGFGASPVEEEILNLREQLLAGLDNARATIDLLSSVDFPTFAQSPSMYVALKPENNNYGFVGDKIAISNGEEKDIEEYKKICQEKVVSHSHAKHSRYGNKPFMVGALSRVTLFSNRLNGEAQKAMRSLKFEPPTHNSLHINITQGIELLYSIERALAIIDEILKRGIRQEKPTKIKVKAASGTGGVEAPRGTLYHSYSFDKKGAIVAADIITPTAQSLANIEKDMKISVERLIGESKNSIAKKLEMVARAYDPCISCSVHTVKINHT